MSRFTGRLYLSSNYLSYSIRSLQLNNVEIEPGRRIGVVRSVDNRRLFIGGIPREIKADQIIVSGFFLSFI